MPPTRPHSVLAHRWILGGVRSLLTFVLLSCCFQSHAAGPPEATVTCSLPNDRQIWPLPTPTVATVVEAEFTSADLLLRIRAGNYFRTITRVVYRISRPRGDFSHEEVSFILSESWPTPESGIMLKVLMNPFGPKTKARFWVSKRHDDLIWDIQTYEIWGDQFHRKPGA